MSSLVCQFVKIFIYGLVTAIACLFAGCRADDSDGEKVVCFTYIDSELVEVELDEPPEYILGGDVGFNASLLQEVKYPAEARADSIEGVYIATYEITISGDIEELTVTQDPGGGIGDEVLRAMRAITDSPSFSPAILNGSPVRVQKDVDVTFRLQ